MSEIEIIFNRIFRRKDCQLGKPCLNDIDIIKTHVTEDINDEVIKFLITAIRKTESDPGLVSILNKSDFIMRNLGDELGIRILKCGFIQFAIADGAPFFLEASSGAVIFIPLGTIQNEGLMTYQKEAEYMEISRANLLISADKKWEEIKSFLLNWESALFENGKWIYW